MTDRALAIRANNKLAESGIHVRQVLIYAMWALENIHIFSWNFISEFGGGSKGPWLTGHKPWFMERGPGPKGQRPMGAVSSRSGPRAQFMRLCSRAQGARALAQGGGPWPMRKMPGVQVVLMSWEQLGRLILTLLACVSLCFDVLGMALGADFDAISVSFALL